MENNTATTASFYDVFFTIFFDVLFFVVSFFVDVLVYVLTGLPVSEVAANCNDNNFWLPVMINATTWTFVAIVIFSLWTFYDPPKNLLNWVALLVSPVCLGASLWTGAAAFYTAPGLVCRVLQGDETLNQELVEFLGKLQIKQ